jgi:hypothetical protein
VRFWNTQDRAACNSIGIWVQLCELGCCIEKWQGLDPLYLSVAFKVLTIADV